MQRTEQFLMYKCRFTSSSVANDQIKFSLSSHEFVNDGMSLGLDGFLGILVKQFVQHALVSLGSTMRYHSRASAGRHASLELDDFVRVCSTLRDRQLLHRWPASPSRLEVLCLLVVLSCASLKSVGYALMMTGLLGP